ncbi:hypothetical protein [Amorphus sp. 3PC139-8]|uniref:hypothetical protein n=1 Tax=Amorphus sp. 3PC139-8 TaxID=2735676 RepID=UPI00345D5BFA
MSSMQHLKASDQHIVGRLMRRLAVILSIGLVVVVGLSPVSAQENRPATDSTGSNYSAPGYSAAADNPPAFNSFPTPSSCGSAQKLQWVNNGWTCVNEVDPEVDYMVHGQWCRAWGAQVRCDLNQPVLYETDPEVGRLWDGNWCRVWGGQVQCDMPQPLMGESDPSIVAKEYGKVCVSYDNVVYCNRNLPTCDWTTQKLYWDGWNFHCAPDWNTDSTYDAGAERNGECRVWSVEIPMEKVYQNDYSQCPWRFGGHVNTVLITARPDAPCHSEQCAGSQNWHGYALCQNSGC